MTDSVTVLDHGTELTFTFADMLRYHGPGSPGGVAHACRAMERAFAQLARTGPLERTQITITTPFGGPGARDAFELVTRAVTGGRMSVDPALAQPQLGRTRSRFVFAFAHADDAVTCQLREGFVVDEFIDLLAIPQRSEDEIARLEVLKHEMAVRIMASPAPEVYDLA